MLGVTMNKKLTLRLDDGLVKFAKEYSAKTGKPISQLPPTVSSLRGILKGKVVTESDYKKYIEEKYL